MIDEALLEAHLGEILEGTGMFLVEIKIDQNNRIRVHVDRDEGVSIDDCVHVSRSLEGKLDRDKEDFALEVSSPGLDAPLRVRRQYVKNIGRMLELEMKEGGKLSGTLREVIEDGIRLEKKTGKKGADTVEQEIPFSEIKSARVQVQF